MTTETMLIKEAAEYLGVTIGTMQRYVRQGKIPAKISETEKWVSFEVFTKDVRELKRKRASSDPSFRRGPRPKGGGQSLMYFPRPAKWNSEITSVISPEERVIILEWFANLRKDAPQQFEKELKEMVD